MRVAVYYAPAVADPLHEAGSRWLGRDATACACPQPDVPDIEALTADARRYGFHATLKPPMRLVPGASLETVVAEAASLAASLTPFELPRLAVADLHGFLALRETISSPALQALADASVAWLDALRAPPDAAELQRRRAAQLSPPREANLRRWGYPDVFGTWRFHMTLTRRLNAAEQDFWQPRAAAHFAAALSQPRMVQDLCVFIEPAPGQPFKLVERLPFGAAHSG
jgi:putative phosphonate metabolism protein